MKKGSKAMVIQYRVTYIGEIEIDENLSEEEIRDLILEDQRYFDNPIDIEYTKKEN